jgi:hypothetical protein
MDATVVRKELMAIAPPDTEGVLAKVAELTPKTRTQSLPEVSPPVAPPRPTRLAPASRASIDSDDSGEHPTTPSARSSGGNTNPSRPSMKRASAAQSSEEEPIPEGHDTGRSQQSVPSGSKRSNTPLYAGLAAVALVAGGGTWAFLSRTSATEQPQVKTPVTKAPVVPPEIPAASTVELVVKASPAAAQIKADGKSCNPCTFERATGEKLKVAIEADGFVGQEKELVFDKSHELEFTLTPAAAAVAVKPSADPPVAATPTPGNTAPKKKDPTPKKKPPGGLTIDESNPYQ